MPILAFVPREAVALVCLEGNYHLRISREQLSRMFAVGWHNLERRFKLATGMSLFSWRNRYQAHKPKFAGKKSLAAEG